MKVLPFKHLLINCSLQGGLSKFEYSSSKMTNDADIFQDNMSLLIDFWTSSNRGEFTTEVQLN